MPGWTKPSFTVFLPLLFLTIAAQKLKSRVLRFIENNDRERFLRKHSLEEAKLAAALTFTHGLWDYYRSLTRLRSESAELSRGTYCDVQISPVAAQKQVIAFERSYNGQTLTVVANLDESPIAYRFANEKTDHQIMGNEITFFKNGLRLNFSR